MRSVLVFAICLLGISWLTGCYGATKQDVPRLIKELGSKDHHTRNKAALDLASLGEDAKPAVRPLIRVLENDPNNGVRSSAAYALTTIGTPEALAAIEKYKKNHPPGS